jgi:hypothetical protein
MSKRTSARVRALATQTGQLAMAVPQVMAHRLTRMALAGAAPSAADRKEFHRMGAEKAAAVGESLNAMALQTVLAQQRAATSLALACWSPSRQSTQRLATHWTDAVLGVLDAGMTPFHRRATANAKRLGGRR